ncbi:type II secretion system protein I [Phaeobacter sp. CECT 5382]|uniref:prepilin-type N-terminal cleavage/methylation domain-containing protein n=1 Tax=Phaeobacter sp. CECT 5382 TaxID=1712645 RepID=UPI0006DB8675|nr:prepilin-type N-terminal cleavage/methylation domain-containing protein [Phaeobacter sp. CECT 5382]CUH89341.1 type II secretion system protein I [Phaeobacter sp. CECT 5382]
MRRFLALRPARRPSTKAQAKIRATRGLTLLELAVAILVLALGSLAALRATDQSRRAIGGEMPRLLARIAARNRAEELQLHGFSGPGLPREVQMGGQPIHLQVTHETTAGGLILAVVTARASSGEAAQLSLYLTAEPRQ